MAQSEERTALIKRLKQFLQSKHGKTVEHYATVFAAAAGAALLASADHFAGIHGVHAYAAVAVGVLATAAKAGYDAVRVLLLPTVAAWIVTRKSPQPPAPPAT